MTKEELITKFLCPGCVAGMDTGCGRYQARGYGPINSEGAGCESHVLGTFIMGGAGNIALGMPKGFNRPGWCQLEKRTHNQMPIYCWPKGTFDAAQIFNPFNIPVWALEYEGDLFVRVAQPRTGNFVTLVIEDGKAAELCPQALNMTDQYGTYD